MLLSMTGFGEARRQDPRRTVAVEVRSVNNRHLKLTCKLPDRYAALDPEVERQVRESVRRGTLNVLIRIDTPPSAERYRINQVALESYRSQIEGLLGPSADSSAVLTAILGLPGVVETGRSLDESDEPAEAWPLVSATLTDALETFQQSRAREGRAMQAELLSLGRAAATHLADVTTLAPTIVAGYRDRLLERVRSLIDERGATLQPGDLVREVAIFAERTDIAEEITRLKAHLEQYEQVIASDTEEAAGRKLEFIVQEMGRETNTMGSKAGDVAISRAVVEIKGALERIRELIQNVE